MGKTSRFVPHGGIFFGSLVNCDAKDDSTYCKIVKLFNLLMMCIVILVILYFIYTFAAGFISSKKGRSSK
jgi:hypothetical protein